MDNSVGDTLRALFIGVLVAVFLQGVLTVQTYNYYLHFPSDPLRIRIVVGMLWILDFSHLVITSEALYSYAVTQWDDESTLRFSKATLEAHIVPLALVIVICQGFFIYRIWLFRRSIFIIPLAIACLATFGLSLAWFIVSGRDHYNGNIPVAALAGSAITDVAIAGTMCWYLYQGKNDVAFPNSRTSSLITRLIYQVGATALATGLLGVAVLVAYIVQRNSFIYLAFHLSLGPTYINSLLINLNARANSNNQTEVFIPLSLVISRPAGGSIENTA